MDSLKDLYIDQLQDLYSADKQALSVSKDLAKAASNSNLKEALERNVGGISKGMEKVKTLIQLLEQL